MYVHRSEVGVSLDGADILPITVLEHGSDLRSSVVACKSTNCH